VRDRDGRITTVDVPFPNLRGIGDINDHGEFVGTYIDAAGGVRGFRREPDGEFTPVDVPGAGTLPLGINNRGQVVGIYGDEGTVNNPDGSYPRYRVHGFVWDERRVTKVDVPGSVLTYAFGINNRGEITGGYYDTAGTERGFVFERGRYRTIASPGRTENAAWGINDRGEIVVPEPTTRLITVAPERSLEGRPGGRSSTPPDALPVQRRRGRSECRSRHRRTNVPTCPVPRTGRWR
jgi:uncharacterized membrane protein